MLFNSLEFGLFFPLIFCLYWFRLPIGVGQLSTGAISSSPTSYSSLNTVRYQNILLLVASYVFYGWWDWRFLGLIALSSAVDYGVGLQLGKSEKAASRKAWLYLSLGVNLGMLGLFKYYNFFVESFVAAFAGIGISIGSPTLSLILPVGISFYTFQTLSYTIDIYRKELAPCQDPVAFFAFVSFFPQLVAGPIERASNLLPQFFTQRRFELTEAAKGLKQILWGLFKKVVIADNCAIYANQIFGESEQLSGSVLMLGGIYFAMQVYGDFSGYSDIAIGTARLLGFKLLPNFNTPYFSTSISGFWRRWHISLNTWFIDYIYTPLAMSKREWGMKGILYAILLTFTLSGLWHGANWTFVMWGFLHALALAYEALTKKQRRRWKKKAPPWIWGLGTGLLTFSFVCLTDIFFRAESLTHAGSYLQNLFGPGLFALPDPLVQAKFMPWVAGFMLFEWVQRNEESPLDFPRFPRPVRWMLFYLVLYLISNYGAAPQSFIYFQF